MSSEGKYPGKHAGGGGGCGLGCIGIGCVGLILVVFGGVIAGYYTLFYTSVPLQLMESAIEESGEVEIEGLEGSLSSGFSADEFKFKADGENWSVLTDISFKYDQNSSMFGSDKLVIKDLSVGGGTIYGDFDPEDQQFDFDNDFKDEFDEEFSSQDEAEIKAAFGQLEVRLEKVEISNLKFVNPKTELEYKVDEILFENFVFNRGDFENLIYVNADGKAPAGSQQR